MTTLPALIRPLGNRDFALLWSGQTVSLVGDLVNQVALPLQALILGASPLQIGAISASGMLVQVVLLLAGGALVDRLPRRPVILACDLSSGVILAVVAVLSGTGTLRIEHLYVAAGLRGIALSFFMPAMGAYLPEIVPEELLMSGNALKGLSRQIGRVGGPLLGGVLVATSGPASAFAVDAGTFFVSFGLLLGARGASTRQMRVPRRFLTEVREGLAFTFSLPWLWITIFGFALLNLAFIGSLSVAIPILVRDRWQADPHILGALVAFIGVGELVGSVIAGVWHVRRVGLTMYLFEVLASIGLALIGLINALPADYVAAALLGMGIAVFGVLWESSLQRHVPRYLLGRVTSVDYLGAVLLGPVGPFAVAAAVVVLGPGAVIAACGLGSAALCLAALVIPSIRRL